VIGNYVTEHMISTLAESYTFRLRLICPKCISIKHCGLKPNGEEFIDSDDPAISFTAPCLRNES